MQIKEYCKQIYELLAMCNESGWANAFKEMYIELDNDGDEKDYLRKLLGVYGGLGSFNDVVFYQGMNVDIVNTNKLDELRKGLFNALKEKL